MIGGDGELTPATHFSELKSSPLLAAVSVLQPDFSRAGVSLWGGSLDPSAAYLGVLLRGAELAHARAPAEGDTGG